MSHPGSLTSDQRCRVCMRLRQARYAATPKGRARTKRGNDKYRATDKGFISGLRHQVRSRIARNEARVAELEAMLNAHA